MIELAPLGELSFPDAQVMMWVANDELIHIQLDNGFLFARIETSIDLFISGWHSISSQAVQDGQWVRRSEVEPLKDICECVLTSHPIILRGFGSTSGLWIGKRLARPH